MRRSRSADIGAFWNRGKRDSYKLYSSSAWTPLRVEYYQKLLDLPVRPTEEEWKIQESEPYFEYLLDHEGPGEKTGPFKLFAHLDHSSDGVLLYDEVPQTDPNFPLHAQAYGYQMDDKGEVQRQLMIEDVTESPRLVSGWKQWEIVGFRTWLQNFEKALQEDGELVPQELFILAD